MSGRPANQSQLRAGEAHVVSDSRAAGGRPAPRADRQRPGSSPSPFADPKHAWTFGSIRLRSRYDESTGLGREPGVVAVTCPAGFAFDGRRPGLRDGAVAGRRTARSAGDRGRSLGEFLSLIACCEPCRPHSTDESWTSGARACYRAEGFALRLSELCHPTSRTISRLA
jgi:hypothetical protein